MELEKSKPILCLDFDGVIHSYSSGWKGAAFIPDPPVPGAIEFIDRARAHFRIAIFSSRSNQPGGMDAMKGWLAMFVRAEIDDIPDAEYLLQAIEWPTEKPPAMITIDDRALTFNGTWPKIETLKAFQPWNKKPPAATLEAATALTSPETGGGAEATREAAAYVIWSNEHGAWWRPKSSGYTRILGEAGRYDKAEAEATCRDGGRARAWSTGLGPYEEMLVAPPAAPAPEGA